MKVLDPGHMYELDSLDGREPFILRFVKRKGERYPGNTGSYSGPTSQEVLRAVLDRLAYVDQQAPHPANILTSHYLQCAIWCLEERHANIHGRTLVEYSPTAVARMQTCFFCGHVLCEEHASETDQLEK